MFTKEVRCEVSLQTNSTLPAGTHQSLNVVTQASQGEVLYICLL